MVLILTLLPEEKDKEQFPVGMGNGSRVIGADTTLPTEENEMLLKGKNTELAEFLPCHAYIPSLSLVSGPWPLPTS